jgi:hypothetical protein
MVEMITPVLDGELQHQSHPLESLKRQKFYATIDATCLSVYGQAANGNGAFHCLTTSLFYLPHGKYNGSASLPT